MYILFIFGFFGIAYFLWARRIEKNIFVDCVRPTPAFELYDGKDYVPTRPSVLFGHHFASIAGAGPIVGPVLAVKFGWLPVILWLVIGVVLIGAVHDFASIITSVRHKGRNIGETIGIYIGDREKKAYYLFTISAVLLVIAVFIRIVSKTFENNPQSATASLTLILLAIPIGILNWRVKISTLVLALVSISICFLCVFLGMKYPLKLPANWWMFILVAYCFFASILPVWLLLQPRDYTNSFLLYFFLILGTVGIVKGWNSLTFNLPAFSSWTTDLGYLFPMLFVTVACGAVSGFHSLVSSGTTSKQISSECHAKPIGYGGMLLEGVLGVIALTSACVISQEEYLRILGPRGDGAISVFSSGMTKIFSFINLPSDFASTFSSLALSAFALTSLDTATRIARYLVEELVMGKESEKHVSETKIASSAITVLILALALLLLFSGGATVLWQLFGTANQLLAAFALLTASLYAVSVGARSFYFFVPAVFMFVVTISALLLQILNFFDLGAMSLITISLSILLLSLYLIFKGVFSISGVSGARYR